ncbi:MAG: phosphatase PAP2 family protein [Thermoprotei archaeon]
MSLKTRVVLTACFFIVISLLVKIFGEPTSINTVVFRAVNTHQSSYLNTIMLYLSRYGREYVWIPVVFVLWLPGGEYRRSSFLLFVTFILAIILGTVAKAVMAEPRPFDVIGGVSIIGPRPTDYSYPSGHALIVGAGAIVALNTLQKKYSLPLLGEALAVSYSRMYLGVHWPADILGGWLLGAFCAGIVFYEEYRLKPIYEFLSDFWDRIIFSIKYHREEEEEGEE